MIVFSDCTVVQNPDDLKDLSFTKGSSKKIRLVEGSGVDTDHFVFSEKARIKIRQEAGFTDAHRIFMCVTRLIWEKGIAEMVEAFRTLEKEHPEVRLVIIGDPDMSNPKYLPPTYMTAQTKGNVMFWGRMSNVAELLSAADIFIFPSYYREGIPRGILEALSVGLPVITTKMPGCDLTVEDKKNGLLIEPQSAPAIAAAVSWLAEHESQLAGMKSLSRKLAVERFSEELIFAQLRDVYPVLLNRTPVVSS
jgi:glycosyltransferase involved in cell wall biosynthesis